MTTLYDTAADVVVKALRGLERSPGQAATAAGLPLDAVSRFLHGSFDPETADRLAEPLGLDEDALANFPEPRLPVELPEGIERIELPFEGETVNAWSLEHGESMIVVDAGFGPRDLTESLPGDGMIDLLITHTHRDHVGGIAALTGRTRTLHSPVPMPEATVVRAGDTLAVAGLAVTVFDLSGHHPEAVGYHIDGFEVPVVAVGDAVFANSAGGCPGPEAYTMARKTIVDALRDLSEETLILTGHGPATTLGTERLRNPFLAAWLSAADGDP